MTAPVSSDLAWLGDLERAHAAATRGEWYTRSGHLGPAVFSNACGRPGIGHVFMPADAALIVAAVNAVPTLIAELRKRDAALREFATLAESYPLGTDVPVYRIGRILAALSPESVQS